MNEILSGNAIWCYDFEVENRNRANDFSFQFSGIKPFHCHYGIISLTNESIKINGDIEICIKLTDLTELYLGFDENYNITLSKNFGLLWQPLRLTQYDGNIIYIIIDYNFFSAKNKLWFTKLRELLS